MTRREPKSHPLRVVTYNIHKGIGGLDLKYRPERVIEVLERCAGDLVLLQEVDEGVPRSRGDRQVDVIGDALRLEHRAFHPNVTLRRGRYGNALLSRFPIEHDENVDLTVPPKKRRGALHVRLDVPVGDRARRLWVFNVHLGLSGMERRAQVRRLLAWLRKHHPPHEAGVIIGGDFNDVFDRLGPLLLEPAGFSGSSRPPLTFPAARPLRPLDRLYVRGPLLTRRWYRARTQLARLASDHLPVVSLLDWDA